MVSLYTYQSQLPANIAHRDPTREEYTRKPWPNIQKIWSSVPEKTFTYVYGTQHRACNYKEHLTLCVHTSLSFEW